MSETESLDWCHERHIYVYATTKDCPAGNFRLVLWKNGRPTIGNEIHTEETIITGMLKLYAQIYKKNYGRDNRAA